MAIYTSNLRQFAGKAMKIKDVYHPYRAGGLEINGKFVFKSFFPFPIMEDETVVSGDERTKNLPEGTKMEWREKVWENKQMVFKKVNLSDKEAYKLFMKTYKKVFDLVVELENDMEVIKYKDVKDVGDEVVLQQVSSAKIKDLIGALTEFDVPMVKGKNREGEEAMVPAYDYEDGASKELIEKSFSFKVVGEGLDTKYTYKEKAFNKKDKEGFLPKDEFEDVPF